jgi:hypothetical protein
MILLKAPFFEIHVLILTPWEKSMGPGSIVVHNTWISQFCECWITIASPLRFLWMFLSFPIIQQSLS